MQKSFKYSTQVIIHPMTMIIVGMMIYISYLFLDIPIAKFCRYSLGQRMYETAQDITTFGVAVYYLIAFFFLFLVGRFIIKKPIFAYRSLFIFLSILISGIVCDILKVLFGRARPILLFKHNIYGFHFFKIQTIFLSFPSGHATTITALMTALSFLRPKYFPLFMVIAVIITASRIILTAHFLSDVLMGMYIGMIVTIFVHRFMVKYHLLDSAVMRW